jgi:Flp pilus assembly protein TadG
LKNLISSTRGAAAVEFAIIAPLLFVLIFGIIEFGAILYNQAVITNASREGARYAATFYTNPANAQAQRPTCSEVQNYVATYVNARLISFKTSTPFSTSNVTCPNVTPWIENAGYAGYVNTVGIEYVYDFLVFPNLLGLLSGGSMSDSLELTARTSMRDENQGN